MPEAYAKPEGPKDEIVTHDAGEIEDKRLRASDRSGDQYGSIVRTTLEMWVAEENQ